MLNTDQIDYYNLPVTVEILTAALNLQAKMNLIFSIVGEIRKIDPTKKEKSVYLHLPTIDRLLQIDDEAAKMICGLTGATLVTLQPESFFGSGEPALHAKTVDFDIFVWADHLAGKAAPKAFDRAKVERQVAALESKLSNSEFTSKAPANVVEHTRKQLEDLQRFLQS